MTGHADFRTRRYLPELDGIRAVAILLVFTAHIDTGWWDDLHGSTGVTLFFVLSGFLITTLGLREEERLGRLDLRSFYVRRVFRIYPLYLVVLAFYCVLLLGLGVSPERRAEFVDSLPYYLAFLPEQSLLGPPPKAPFSGAWSLGIEEKFYFVWPLLGFVLCRTRFTRLLALAAVIVACAAAGRVGDVGTLLEPYALIALGCVAAVLLHDERWYGRLAVLSRPVVLGPLLVALAVVQFVTPEIKLGGAAYVVYGLPVTAALVGVVVGRGAVARVLSVRPLLFLGRVSYAFYLTHNFALNAVQPRLAGGSVWVRDLVAPAAALLLAVLVAWLLHVAVERPMIRLGHRLAHRPKDDRSLAPDAAPSAAEAALDVQADTHPATPSPSGGHR